MLIDNFGPFIDWDHKLIFHRTHTCMSLSVCLFCVVILTGRLDLMSI